MTRRLVCNLFDKCDFQGCEHKVPHDEYLGCSASCAYNFKSECIDFMFRKDEQEDGLRAAAADGFEEPTI